MTTTDKSKVVMPTSKGSDHDELVPFTSPSRATDAEKANVTPSPTGKPLINAAALAARSDALANEKAVIVLFPKSGRSMVWNYMKLFKFSAQNFATALAPRDLKWRCCLQSIVFGWRRRSRPSL